MTLVEKVCLYYREGTSDKVYEIHLTEDEDGFRVTGYNGRRGTKLIAQPKTPRPVPYRTARYIFDNLEAAKLNHRRTPYRVASREPNSTTPRGQATAQYSGEGARDAREDVYQAARIDALEF